MTDTEALLAEINRAAHAAGTGAWIRDVLQRAHRALRQAAPSAEGETVAAEHVKRICKELREPVDSAGTDPLMIEAANLMEALYLAALPALSVKMEKK